MSNDFCGSHDEQYIAFCKQGLTTSQIATELNVHPDQLHDPAFISKPAFQRGQVACQAYHETLLQKMIRGDDRFPTGASSAQQFLMESMFRKDWNRKTEQKEEQAPHQALSNTELLKFCLDIQEKNKEAFDIIRESDTGIVS